MFTDFVCMSPLQTTDMAEKVQKFFSIYATSEAKLIPSGTLLYIFPRTYKSGYTLSPVRVRTLSKIFC